MLKSTGHSIDFASSRARGFGHVTPGGSDRGYVSDEAASLV